MATESPLLKLPRELRDSIYDFAIFGEQPIKIRSKPGATNTNKPFASGCSLVLTCKQLSDEYFERFHATVKLNSDLNFEAIVKDVEFRGLTDLSVHMTTMDKAALVERANLHVKLIVSPMLFSSKLAMKLQKWTWFCERDGIAATYGVECASGGREHDICYRIRCLRLQVCKDSSKEGQKVSQALHEWWRTHGVPQRSGLQY